MRIDALHHVGNQTIEDLRRSLYRCLYKHCINIDAQPVTRRFFTFATCFNAMLRMLVLQLPKDVFTVSTIQIRNDSQKRLKNFHKFYTSPEAYF